MADIDVHSPLDHQAQEASERLQLALEAGAIVGTWVWDIPGDRFTADERFARTFGLSPQQCREGLPLKAVTGSIHPDDVFRVEAAIEEALSRGGPYRCEYRVLPASGTYRWIEANGRAELDASAAPRRFLGVLLDIEARRVAEAERDKIAALLRTFAEAVPGVVYAKDRLGRMLVANHGTTQLIGKPPDFYLGKTDLDYLEDKTQAQVVMETDRRIMESGIAEQIEENVSHADGSPATWLSVKTPLLNEHGEVIGLIGSSIDVTARKEAESAVKELNQTLEERVRAAVQDREVAERALHHSQKMEAVGQLTGGIAHDFNNLLAGISGSLELVQIRMAQGRLAEVDKYITVAQGAVTRAASLTHRLLAFSRRQTLSPSPTDINALVRGMEELVTRSVGPAIRLRISTASDLWPALIDPAQLENALLNLCINARDAILACGEIHIHTSNLVNDGSVDLDQHLKPGGYLNLCVSDNGSGMSPETAAKAIEPFFTTKPAGTGTGLGLSMVYGFARQSGGDLHIKSEEGAGTTICLYLPRYEGEVATESTHTAHSVISPANGETVLVVDDEPSIRMLVTELLSSLGYNVMEAADGISGLQLLQSDLRIDVLVSDIGLPGGMNGREMAGIARKSRPGLPVLFITGYAESAVIEKAHLEPRTQVLTKPFVLDALSARVATLVKLSNIRSTRQ